MSTDFIIYHNPKCSKSRMALTILREHGIEPRMVEYLKTPFNRASLRELLRKLGLHARDILRDGEEEYRMLKLDDPALTEDALMEAVVQHPVLLQRPIVVQGARAVLARPPEKVKMLFQ